MEERRTARLLVVDPDDRVLLMRIAAGDGGSSGSGNGLWVTLGGRIEPGESLLSAAGRELREETGITDARVGPVVWYGEQVLEVDGTPRLLRENFVLARCVASPLITDVGWTTEERQAIAEMRWWPLSELSSASSIIKPPRLAELLGELLPFAGSSGSGNVRIIELQ